MARSSKSKTGGADTNTSLNCFNKGLEDPKGANLLASSGRAFKVSRKLLRSLGRALPNAKRALIRSTSATCFSTCCIS